MPQATALEERRLNSWKEIAAYFGNDQRTVKRWESTRGLPVRRLPGARSGVFALVSEIEAWQRGEPVAVRPVEDLVSAAEADLDAEADALQTQLGEPAAADVLVTPPAETIATAAPAVFPAQPLLSQPRTGHMWRAMLFLGVAALAGTVALWHFQAYGAPRQPAHVPLPRAKEFYLQGRFLWNKRTPEALKAALNSFQEAERIDPQYAAAYAGEADCFALSPEFDPRPGNEVYPHMLQASQKALHLDSSLPEGHRALAFALFYWMLDVDASRAEFERALQLAPHDATTHLWYANTLATSGRHDEAIAEIERAREIDPASPSISADHAWVLYVAHRRDEARQSWKQLARTDPDYVMVHTWLAEVDLQEHKPQEYLKELGEIARLTSNPLDRARWQVASAAYAEGGEQAMLQALASLMEDHFRTSRSGAYYVAIAMVRAGRKDAAMDYLERAYRMRDQFPPGLEQSEVFLPLHSMPRFRELAARSARPYPESAAIAPAPQLAAESLALPN